MPVIIVYGCTCGAAKRAQRIEQMIKHNVARRNRNVQRRRYERGA